MSAFPTSAARQDADIRGVANLSVDASRRRLHAAPDRGADRARRRSIDAGAFPLPFRRALARCGDRADRRRMVALLQYRGRLRRGAGRGRAGAARSAAGGREACLGLSPDRSFRSRSSPFPNRHLFHRDSDEPERRFGRGCGRLASYSHHARSRGQLATLLQAPARRTGRGCLHQLVRAARDSIRSRAVARISSCRRDS